VFIVCLALDLAHKDSAFGRASRHPTKLYGLTEEEIAIVENSGKNNTDNRG